MFSITYSSELLILHHTRSWHQGVQMPPPPHGHFSNDPAHTDLPMVLYVLTQAAQSSLWLYMVSFSALFSDSPTHLFLKGWGSNPVPLWNLAICEQHSRYLMNNCCCPYPPIPSAWAHWAHWLWLQTSLPILLHFKQIKAPIQLHFKKWRGKKQTKMPKSIETNLESDSREPPSNILPPSPSPWPPPEDTSTPPPSTADPTHINRMSCDKLGCSHGLPAKGDPELDRGWLWTAEEMLPRKRRRKISTVPYDNHSEQV